MKKMLLTFAMLVVATIALNGGVVEKTYHFDTPLISERGGYHYIEMSDCYSSSNPGHPQLPIKNVSLLMPPGEQAISVSVVKGELVELPGTFNVFPKQYDVPFSETEIISFKEPDFKIYGSNEPYPKKIDSEVFTQYSSGHSIAFVNIQPFLYKPLSGKLYYYSYLKVILETETTTEATRSYNNFYRESKIILEQVKQLVDNPGFTSEYQTNQNPTDSSYHIYNGYLILTNNASSSYFDEFVLFKRKQGYNVILKTVEDIYSEYSAGYDNPDRIRLCIRDAYQNDNVLYVLLGGDVEIIPHRGLYGFVESSSGDKEDYDIPSDLFYMGLDRVGSGSGPDWNTDNDSKWGEHSEADYLMEVNLGRISANTQVEFSNALNKQMKYQRSPVCADVEKALMVGQKFDNEPTWGGDYKDQIVNGVYNGTTNCPPIPANFTVETLYDKDAVWSFDDIKNMLNGGTHLINNAAHSNNSTIMNIENSDITTTNFTVNGENHNYYIIYSQGCYAASFDNRNTSGSYNNYDCVVEELVNCETGCVCFIGNSRYGWYEPGGLNGISQQFDKSFFASLWYSSIPYIGNVHLYGKQSLVGTCNESAYRWVYYELNLFGDPSLCVWKQYPTEFTSINILSDVEIGTSQITVQVAPFDQFATVAICTDNDDNINSREHVDNYGIAVIDLNNPITIEDSIFVTAFGPNFIPMQTLAGWLPGIWEGDISGDWNVPGNWKYNEVPDDGCDVTISSSVANNPWIINSDAVCRNLKIENGAALTIHGYTLEVGEDAKIFGELAMNDNSSELIVYDDIIWYSGSTADISADYAAIDVYDNFIILAGSNVEMLNGTVFMKGSDNSNIQSSNEACHLNNLTISKSGMATVYLGDEHVQKLRIFGDLTIGSNSIFTDIYQQSDLVLSGDLISNGSFQIDNALVEFIGQNQQINLNSNDYFADVLVAGEFVLQDDVAINGDLDNHLGEVFANSYNISLKGDWITGSFGNFVPGTGTVSFTGTTDQNCGTEDFNKLILNKSSGKLIITLDSDVTCQSYDWINGLLKVDGGNFTVNDIYDSSIVGTYLLNSGQIDLHQDANSSIDINGSIIIYDGIFNIHGGDDECYFARSDDSYLYMEGGILDIKDRGIHFDDLHLFTHVITDGIIQMNGSFTSDRHNFSPTGGSIKLYGSNDAEISFGWGNEFHNLFINKSTSDNILKKGDASKRNINDSIARRQSPIENTRSGNVTLMDDLNVNEVLQISFQSGLDINGNKLQINGNLQILGTLTMTDPQDEVHVDGSIEWGNYSDDNVTAGNIFIGGNWYYSGNSQAELGLGNTVHFIGSSPSKISINAPDAKFGNVILEKTNSHTYLGCIFSTVYDAHIAGDLLVTTNNELKINDLEMLVDGEIEVENLAEINMINEGSLTCNDLTIDGIFDVADGEVVVHNNFTLNSGGAMIIDGGLAVLDKPYTGNFMSFLGDLTIINNGFLEITNEALRCNSTPNMDGGTISLGWGFQANVPGGFQPSGGLIRMFTSRNAFIEMDQSNYFYNLEINKPEYYGECTLQDDVTVNNNLHVEDGTLYCSGYELTVLNDLYINTDGKLDPDDQLIQVGGNWTNNRGSAGFVEGTGTVRFINAENSNLIQDETFYNVEIDKSGSQFTYVFIDNGITMNVLNNLDILNCSLRLTENSILNIGNNLLISQDTNIYAENTAPTSINISGNWVCQNTTGYPWAYGFLPGLSTVTFNGNDNQLLHTFHTNMDFYNVVVNNTGINPDYDRITINGNVNILGDFTVLNGIWRDADVTTQEFHGDFDVNDSGWWVPQGHIKFMGSGDNTFHRLGNAAFQDVTINKVSSDNTRGASLTLNSDMYAQNGGNLIVENGTLDFNSRDFICDGDVTINNNGTMIIDDNSILEMGNEAELTVNSGGLLNIVGDSGDEAIITRKNTGHYYDINIEDGGSISAEYAIFEYMGVNGLYVMDGAYVGDGNTGFNNCIFRNGIYGGSLLRVENNQNLTINSAEFPANNWNGLYNIYKGLNQGSLDVVGAFGSVFFIVELLR